VSGRTLFTVLARVLGLWLAIYALTALATVAWWIDGLDANTIAYVGVFLLMGAFALLCIRGPERLARLCRWPETEPAPDETVAPVSWMRVGENAVAWFAVVLLVDPLARIIWGAMHGERLGEALWDLRVHILKVVLLGAIAVWLLLRRGGRVPA
jgi:hypothetical protein